MRRIGTLTLNKIKVYRGPYASDIDLLYEKTLDKSYESGILEIKIPKNQLEHDDVSYPEIGKSVFVQIETNKLPMR